MRARYVASLLGLFGVLTLSGCMLNQLSSGQRLRDVVIGYNDECRWGRNDLAVQRVAPAFKRTFRLSHHSWGRTIQIADLELVTVDVRGDDGTERASSIVQISWYDTRTMTLADTMVRQEWEKMRGHFMLVGETVVEGDARLIEMPEGSEETSEETEGEAAGGESDTSAGTSALPASP